MITNYNLDNSSWFKVSLSRQLCTDRYDIEDLVPQQYFYNSWTEELRGDGRLHTSTIPPVCEIEHQVSYEPISLTIIRETCAKTYRRKRLLSENAGGIYSCGHTILTENSYFEVTRLNE